MSDEVEVDGAYTFGDTVACHLAMIVEDGDNQWPGVGTYYWDANDPLVIALHFEIFYSATVITGDAPCQQCGDLIEADTFGYVHKELEDTVLLCLPCGREKPEAHAEEALWVFGLAELEGALVDAPPAPQGAAQARISRFDVDSYQIELVQQAKSHVLTLEVETLELMLCAIREYQQAHEGEEALVLGYLEEGLAQLESWANQKKRKKK